MFVHTNQKVYNFQEIVNLLANVEQTSIMSYLWYIS